MEKLILDKHRSLQREIRLQRSFSKQKAHTIVVSEEVDNKLNHIKRENKCSKKEIAEAFIIYALEALDAGYIQVTEKTDA